MKAKYSGFACIAATLSILAFELPAQAMSLTSGSTLNLQTFGKGGVGFDVSTGMLDFFSVNDGTGQGIEVAKSFGSFSKADRQPAPQSRIMDLMLSNDGGGIFSLPATKIDFLTGIDLEGNPGLGPFNTADDLSFNLTEFIFDTGAPLVTNFRGDFLVDGVLAGIGTGSFTTQLTDFTKTNSYSLTIDAEPIPTPALLPGLLGFGATVLRKRKQGAAAA